MPRAMRVEYPGAIYHVIDRGDRCKDIFVDDVDRQDFLKTLAEACQETGWQVHAYCLMRNHGCARAHGSGRFPIAEVGLQKTGSDCSMGHAGRCLVLAYVLLALGRVFDP